MKNKQYIVLDLGRVCLDIDPHAFFTYLDEAIEAPDSVFWQQQKELECGRLTEEDFFAFVMKFFANRHSLEKLKKAYCSIIKDEIAGMAPWIKKKKAEGYGFIMFSDTSAIHIEFTKTKLSYFDEFDERVFSYDVGSRKPHQVMYLAVEKICAGKPVVFADDKQINIDGAQARQWPAIQFLGTQQFISDFENLSTNNNKIKRLK